MRSLTASHLHKLFPALTRKQCEEYAPHFSAAVREAKIDTRARLCAFVAQLGHESKDLRNLREIWGPTAAQARYDVRVDLGNTPERDGDGKLYMGRGGLQRTGKTNYARAAKALGLPLLQHPELVEKPEHAFRSDALYWTDHNLNKLADRLTLRGDHKDLDTLDKITKIVNGGYNGRVDRQRRYLVAIATLPEEIFQPEEPKKSSLDVVNEHVNATPPPVAQQPVNEKDATPKVLIEKLAKKEGAKTVARGLGRRLAEPFGLLLTALGAGNVYAWIGVVAVVAVIGWIIYRERHSLRNHFQRIVAWLPL
jgi:putative chitinase